ncbi:DUF6602 domain-containing protein [Aeromonas hydrophila]|uniref:DUF6602 domain-containing protein n=1 Tax=Aeromonas hydrophila TaxID=644 RepID=UPI002B460C0B|nr:DUF6602 domain-containing protein [Aeromonas hydrophila]
MTSKIYEALVDHKIKIFKEHFSTQSKALFWDDKSKKLIHAGEYGRYREDLTSELLKQFTPKHIEFSTGFIVTPQDNVSTQCDLILYDKDFTPALSDGELNYFFPVDSVISVCEVKSDINTRADLENILIKLSNVKKLSHERSQESAPTDGRTFDYENGCNDVFTFVVCNKMEFKLNELPRIIDDLYIENNINHRYRHNLIYSLNDGLVIYKDISSNQLCSYPVFSGVNGITVHQQSSDKVDRMFLSQVYTALSFIQRVCVNLTAYL